MEAVFEELIVAGALIRRRRTRRPGDGAAGQAVAVEQGQPIMEKLVAAELHRTGAEPGKRWEIEALATSTLESAAQQGLLPEGGEREFAQQIVRAAASALAPADSANRARSVDQIVDYYGDLRDAGDMMARLDRPPAPVEEPQPGRALSPEEIVRRWAPRIRAEAGGS